MRNTSVTDAARPVLIRRLRSLGCVLIGTLLLMSTAFAGGRPSLFFDTDGYYLMGENLASATYWQGTLAAQAARRWVALYTRNQGTFTTTSCEDAGFMQALTFLGRAGRVDLQRVMILRTVSDYCAPPPGMSSVESLQYGPGKAYLAMRESFQSAYLVGSVVVRELADHWDRYRDAAP